MEKVDPIIPFIPADAAVLAIDTAIDAEYPEPPTVIVTDVSQADADAPTPGWWRIDVYRHEARRHTLYVLPARAGGMMEGETEGLARMVAGYLAGGPCTSETGK